MPDKTGRLSRQEKQYAAHYAETNNRKYAATQAGYPHPDQRATQLMQRPAVIAEIARVQQERLFNDILPLAVRTHQEILADPKAPAGARMQAVKLAYDRTLGSQEGSAAKEPHEMTAEEIAKMIDQLEQVAAARAKPVLPPPSEDIFA